MLRVGSLGPQAPDCLPKTPGQAGVCFRGAPQTFMKRQRESGATDQESAFNWLL
jgi:hypothetical protein